MCNVVLSEPFDMYRTNIEFMNTRRIDNLHTPVGKTEAIYKTFSFCRVYIKSYLAYCIN